MCDLAAVIGRVWNHDAYSMCSRALRHLLRCTDYTFCFCFCGRENRNQTKLACFGDCLGDTHTLSEASLSKCTSGACCDLSRL